jgi:hypothetical protein
LRWGNRGTLFLLRRGWNAALRLGSYLHGFTSGTAALLLWNGGLASLGLRVELTLRVCGRGWWNPLARPGFIAFPNPASVTFFFLIWPAGLPRLLNGGIQSGSALRARRRIFWRQFTNGLGDNRGFWNWRSDRPGLDRPCSGCRLIPGFQSSALLTGALHLLVTLDKRLPLVAVDRAVTHRTVGSSAVLIESARDDHAVLYPRLGDCDVPLLDPSAGRTSVFVVPPIAIRNFQAVLPVPVVPMMPAVVRKDRIVTVPA